MPAQKSVPMPDSFIRTARRAQLIECAIDTIADLGVDQASMVQIAARANVSRGVATYHFTNRDELVDAVIEEVYATGEKQVKPGVVAAPTPRDALLAFVAGSVDFYAAFPKHMAALVEITHAARRSPTRARRRRARHIREMSDVAALLRAGQDAGQFRAFDCEIVATMIRAMLDSAAQAVAQDGATEALRAEMVSAADALTRSAR
ncbi:TetR/AcrR family transcriptional regulator [Gordonia bronchialis]|nr:TetR family transcriptional regulator [Gordonia bronchialis]MCC3321895.1 TetR family transcriptional regulator [Gordonia bronchialis]